MPSFDRPEQSKSKSPDRAATDIQDKPDVSLIHSKIRPISKDESDRLVNGAMKDLAPSLGFPTPKLETGAGDESRIGHPLKKLKKDWLVSLDITVHLGTDTAKSQTERLQVLAKDTRGKSVALVVQDVEPGVNGKPPELHRYMLADGEVRQLSTEVGKGFAADAASLVQEANKLVDGAKTAFIEMGHGNGNYGFKGDDGPCEVKDLARALLTANGKPLNDVVLNSCLVAQDGAIKALAKAAKDDVVASAELGGNADDSVRGLNYEKTLLALIKAPSMDGKALAKKFIADGENHGNIYPDSKGEPAPGIRDLTAFDPAKVQNFEDKLGKFGNALKDAESEPGNRSELQKLISGTFKYNLADDADQKRDLSSFAKSVQNAIREGSLKDPTNNLIKSTEEILAAQKDMTDATYGEGKYAGLGGLSVHLPSSEHVHHRDSKNPNLMDMVQSFVKTALDEKRVDDNKVHLIHNQIGLLANAISEHPELAAKASQLNQIADSINGASTSEARIASIHAFQQMLKELSSDKAFMKVFTQTMSLADRYDLAQSENSGWSKFIASLYGDEMYAA